MLFMVSLAEYSKVQFKKYCAVQFCLQCLALTPSFTIPGWHFYYCDKRREACTLAGVDSAGTAT